MEAELSKREEQRQESGHTHRVLPQRHASQCGVENWLSFLGHRWNALILWRLSERPHSFSELSAGLPGITPKVLTERLSGLLDRGLVSRVATSTFPQRTSYALTNLGEEISTLLAQLHRWTEDRASVAAL